MSLLFLILPAACVLFVLGWYLGARKFHANDRDAQRDQFEEAMTLWQRATDQIEELSQRNVVQFGSVRERMIKLDRKLDEVKLADRYRRASKQDRTLKEQPAIDHDDEQSPVARIESPLVNTDRPAIFSDSFVGMVSELISKVDAGAPRDELLDFVYDELPRFVPCQRIGYAEIDYEADLVKAVWSRSDRPSRLKIGYAAKLSTSSLRLVAELNRPRLLNLRDYLHAHPDSKNTRLVVEEGFGSSLTFPIVVDNMVVAFLFLTSVDSHGFNDQAIDHTAAVATQISRAISRIGERGTLASV